MWIEMWREDSPRDAGWAFTETLWSPIYRRRDARRWPYWDTLLSVQKGDTIYHLRGKGENARFVGYSEADTDGFKTRRRPPNPGANWQYANEFYRVALTNFTQFTQPLRVIQLFKERSEALTDYLRRHGRGSEDHRLLFYVLQSDRIQCQNGAYLSHCDEELASILFSQPQGALSPILDHRRDAIDVGEGTTFIATRRGQKQWSEMVRSNHEGRCCFPECDIIEDDLLVASHIARWADAPRLRGAIGNGLCLCLLHDRAFERGLFTIDETFRVRVHAARVNGHGWAIRMILPSHGLTIRLGRVAPDKDALAMHWDRIGLHSVDGAWPGA